MTVIGVFATVTAGALFGMLLGGAFGAAAGYAAPELFRPLLWPPGDDPLAAAVVLGAGGGVVAGGALAVFAITVSVITDARRVK